MAESRLWDRKNQLIIMNNMFSLFANLQIVLSYDFMQHAFEAGTLVAIVAGVVGYFIVLRRSSFAAHALSHAGFTGAAGAVLLGWNPLIGLFACTGVSGVIMALLGRRAANRDLQIGVVLSFVLGLGVLFMNLYKGYSTEAYSLLFGEIIGIRVTDVWITLAASVFLLIVFSAMYQPLLFSSLDEEAAEAKGLPVVWIGTLFLLLVAIATSVAVQVVGVLLIFSLLVTPAAIAQRLTTRPFYGMLVSVVIALFATWFGLIASFYIPYPVSFFITSVTFGLYVVVRVLTALRV